jgi:hypothetical protein
MKQALKDALFFLDYPKDCIGALQTLQSFKGTDQEKLAKVREVKEEIKGALKEWIAAIKDEKIF